MKWLLVLIAWNGTLAVDPVHYVSKAECESAGEFWKVESKGKVADARYVCVGRALR